MTRLSNTKTSDTDLASLIYGFLYKISTFGARLIYSLKEYMKHRHKFSVKNILSCFLCYSRFSSLVLHFRENIPQSKSKTLNLYCTHIFQHFHECITAFTSICRIDVPLSFPQYISYIADLVFHLAHSHLCSCHVYIIMDNFVGLVPTRCIVYNCYHSYR